MNETTEYEQLLADLAAVENLQKSIPPAADGEGNGDPENKEKGKKPDGEGAVDPADKQVAAAAAAEQNDGDGYGDLMGKSMTVFDAEGKPVNAVDGTELIKSLIERVDSIEDKANGAGQLAKALTQTVQLVGQQAELIKSLQERVNALSGEGRGRKSAVVFPIQKPDASQQMAKAMGNDQQQGMPVHEFMAKALTAQAQGLITGLDVSRAESHLNHRLPVPADIVSRVAQVK